MAISRAEGLPHFRGEKQASSGDPKGLGPRLLGAVSSGVRWPLYRSGGAAQRLHRHPPLRAPGLLSSPRKTHHGSDPG